MAKRDERVMVRRMSNLGAWEMYRVALEDSDEVICLLGLAGAGGEYALFPRGERDATQSSKLSHSTEGRWSDASRRKVVSDILDKNIDLLPRLSGGREIAFDIDGSQEAGHEHGGR
jgi:hypothetical protein